MGALPVHVDTLDDAPESMRDSYTGSPETGYFLDLEEQEIDGVKYGMGLVRAIRAERRRCAELEQQHARIAGFEEIFGSDGKGLYRARRMVAGELTPDDLEAMPRRATKTEADYLDEWIAENAPKHLADMGVADTPENRMLFAGLLGDDPDVREKASRALTAQHPDALRLRKLSAQLLDVGLRDELTRELSRRGYPKADIDFAVRALKGRVAPYYDADDRPRFAAADESGEVAWRVTPDGYEPQGIADALDALEINSPQAYATIVDGGRR